MGHEWIDDDELASGQVADARLRARQVQAANRLFAGGQVGDIGPHGFWWARSDFADRGWWLGWPYRTGENGTDYICELSAYAPHSGSAQLSVSMLVARRLLTPWYGEYDGPYPDSVAGDQVGATMPVTYHLVAYQGGSKVANSSVDAGSPMFWGPDKQGDPISHVAYLLQKTGDAQMAYIEGSALADNRMGEVTVTMEAAFDPDLPIRILVGIEHKEISFPTDTIRTGDPGSIQARHIWHAIVCATPLVRSPYDA